MAAFLRDVRAVVWFVVLLAGLFVADKARAADVNHYFETEAAALSQCQLHGTRSHVTCAKVDPYTFTTGGNTYVGYFWSHDNGSPTAYVYYYKTRTPTGPSAADVACAAEPSSDTLIQFPNGSVYCDVATDCLVYAVNIGDGGPVRLSPFEQEPGIGVACDTGDWECPDGYLPETNPAVTGATGFCIVDDEDTDDDGIPNEGDPTPFDEGEQPRDTDGDGVPDNRDVFPLDPDNGQDLESGETTPTASGGGNCSTPPVVNGDAVGAQVAYQTWATRCAVDRLNATTKGGVSVTVVGGSTGSGNSTQAEIDGLSDGEGMAASGDAAGLTQDLEFGADGLDDTRFGAQVGGTCPVIPPIDLGALGTLEIDTTKFCEWMELTSILVLILASLGSLRILGGPA